jgi:antitoxin (DNA-binding transcriptional repressor) of toxin-antitoxin stability system
MSMTTLTATEARTNLSALLQRALDGQDIGIIVKGRIIALRPVEVVSTDYIEKEYGLDSEEWDRAAKHLHEKGKKARASGKAKRFTGSLENDLKG